MNKKIVRLFFSALVACSTAAAWAWGDSDWGFSSDYLEDALETDLVWRNMEASQNAVRLSAGGSASRARDGDVPEERKNMLYAGEAGTTRQVIDTRGLESVAAIVHRSMPDTGKSYSWYRGAFKEVMISFNQKVEKLYGVPPNYLATGMTVMLAGAYAAYHNQPFPESFIRPVFKQMERMMSNDESIQQAQLRSKRFDYQVMLMTGLILQSAQMELQKKPNAAQQARLRRMGARYLQKILNAEPERIVFSSSGVHVR